MNLRTIVEARILFILLSFKSELNTGQNTFSSFDVISKHNLIHSDFKDVNHQWIFKAIINQYHQGLENIDLVTLVKYRPKEFKSFPQQKNEFMIMVNNLLATNYAPYSELEKLLFQLKTFILEEFWTNQSHKILQTHFSDTDAMTFGDRLTVEYENLKMRLLSGINGFDDNVSPEQELRQRIERNASGIFPGVPVKHQQISDYLQGGWLPPDLIIIGARPSMGKTSFILALMRETMDTHHVAFFTLEVMTNQVYDKFAAALNNIDYMMLKTGKINPEYFPVIEQTYKYLKNTLLKIYGKARYFYLENIKNECRRLKKLGELQMVIIDYLQLIKTEEKFSNRQEAVSHISRELKLLALELQVPIMALSQLKRPDPSKKVLRPTLTDLRESGSIEQDADLVGFLHRQAYYRDKSLELDYSIEMETELIFEKGRDLGVAYIKFINDVRNLQLI